MKSRLISFLLIVATVASTLSVANAEKTEISKNDRAFNMNVGLGIIDEDKEKDSNLTRAEFAHILCNLCGFLNEEDKEEDWFDGFFGDADENMSLVVSDGSGSEYYTDVDMSHEYYDDINMVSSARILKGFGDGNFKPDANITNLQVLTTMINILGYENYAGYYGGYPNGYAAMAEGLEISQGISLLTANATFESVARIIYNSLEVGKCKLTSADGNFQFSADSSKTILSEVLEMEKISGIMTDNGLTSLAGESDVAGENVIIGGKKLAIDDINDRNFIGYNVTAYYLIEDEKVVYVEKNDRNDEISLTADEFVSYSDYILRYRKNGGSSEKRASIAKNASVIYNGFAERSFDENTFKFSDGTITLLAPEGGNQYKTIIVNNYENWFVSESDNVNYKIYNAAQDTDVATEDAMIDLSEEMGEKRVFIYDENGKAVDFSAIKPGDVLNIARGGKDNGIVRIIISTKNALGVQVKSLGYDENDNTVIVASDGTEYTVSPSYYNTADQKAIRLNDAVNLYINAFGNVAWLTKEGTSDYTVGYVVKVRPLEDDNCEPIYSVKLYTENGKMETLYIREEKIKFRSGDSSGKADAENVYNSLKDYYGLVAYAKDENDNLTYIEMPSEERNMNGAFQVMYKNPGVEIGYRNNGSWHFFGNDKVIMNAGTRVFKVPKSIENKDNEKLYDTKGSFVYNQKYEVASYGFDGLSGLAQYVVWENDTATAGEFSLNSGKEWKFVVVTDIYGGLNSDDESGTIIEGASIGHESALTDVELFCTEVDGVISTDVAGDTLNSGKTYKIQKGDIIRYLTDSSGEKVEKVELFFRLDGENPAYPDGKKGFLAGSIGKFDTSVDCGRRYNPWVYTHNDRNNGYQGLIANPINDSGNVRAAYGYVYNYQDGLISYTTENILQNDFNPKNTNCLYEQWIPYAQIATITKEGKNYSVVKGMTDMKTYRDYGSDCSRIITLYISGLSSVTLIINSDV